MGKRELLVVVFCWLTLCGAGELTLLDAAAFGALPARKLAISLAMEQGDKLSIRPAKPLEAISALEQGRAELAIMERRDLPKNCSLGIKPYGILAAVLYVNAANRVQSISKAAIRTLFSSPNPTWEQLAGMPEDIHLFGLKSSAEGAGLFSALALPEKMDVQAAVFRVDSSQEVLLLCGGNPMALGVALYWPNPGTRVRMLAVDGVAPSMENLSKGRYPLATELVVLFKKPASPMVERFLAGLRTSDFLESLDESNMLPL